MGARAPERGRRSGTDGAPNSPPSPQEFPLAGWRSNGRPRRRSLVRWSLGLADLVSLTGAFFLAQAVAGGALGEAGGMGWAGESLLFLALLPLWLVAARLYGLYGRDEERAEHSTVYEVVRIFHLVTVAVWAVFVVAWLSGVAVPAPGKLAAFWGMALGLVVAGRGLARAVARHSPSYRVNAVIVGAGDVGQLIGRKIRQHPEYGINLMGFVDAEPKEIWPDLVELPVLGTPDDLPEIVQRHRIGRVVVAFSKERHDQLLEAIRSLRGLGVRIDVVPRLFEALGPQIDVHAVEGLPLVTLGPTHVSREALLVKRALDLALAGAALVFLAPLLALIALLVKLDCPGPVFFRQRRLGQGMREFTMLKFRTMRVETDDGAHRRYVAEIMDTKAPPRATRLYKLEREGEVTRLGRWLRRTSLDELPQLWNVVRGEMSLVGPRPPIPYETDLYEPHHFERFLVPAGMTGLWQVTARARSTMKEALDLDVAYARDWSLALDLKLLARTPFVLLRDPRTA